MGGYTWFCGRCVAYGPDNVAISPVSAAAKQLLRADMQADYDAHVERHRAFLAVVEAKP